MDKQEEKRMDVQATLLEQANDSKAKPYVYVRRSQEEIDADQKEQSRQRTLREMHSQAGSRAKTWRFRNFIPNSEYQAKVKKKVIEWMLTFKDRQLTNESLVLYGPVGTGKDHLAFSAAGEAVFNHYLSCEFVNGRELFATLRATMTKDAVEKDKEILEYYIRPDLLVLSDPIPPIGEITRYEADSLYMLINSRYMRRKLTIATLNVANDEEADLKLGAPTWDRLCHGSWKIFCCWESHRKPALELKPSSEQRV